MFVKMILSVKNRFRSFEVLFFWLRFGFWTTFLRFINGFGEFFVGVKTTLFLKSHSRNYTIPVY